MGDEFHFYPGQLVWLKSGSSSMTVNEVSSKDQATCIWFDYDQSPLRYEKKLPFHVLSSLPVPAEDFAPRVGDFKVGDVVSLRSGGPLMTIEVIREFNAECLWFDMELREIMPLSGTFCLAALVAGDPQRAVTS
ncbi:uncharacterized protein YodC (DUF2158 family) [Aeromonas veronii]|uniref:DUF2158 domain-containing protein n=1 Tax=Aeromonas veronii TaxID=654 RepID=UPI00161AC989|nr:DUF2158 domain-containing protein [Aeromonas veronii]MCS3833239.1 uncharacterized protein YodC (DUF2158 family) [Aeromonas veronii]